MRGPNRAGKSTRSMAAGRRKNAIWIAIGTLALMVILALLVQSKAVAGISGGVLVLIVLMRVIGDVGDKQVGRYLKEERRALRGAVAEETVALDLDELGETYYAIHDVPSPYGNIDHVLLNRSGAVYLIETKSHRGKVEVEDGELLLNGNPPEKDFVAQALRNAAWLGGELSSFMGTKVWVRPLIVFTNAFVPRISPLRGVRIVNKRFLSAALHEGVRSSAAKTAIWERRDEVAASLQ
jgi:hypothetical protein